MTLDGNRGIKMKYNVFDYIGMYIMTCLINLIIIGIPFIINYFTLQLENVMLLLFLVTFSSLFLLTMTILFPPKKEEN